MKERQAWAEAAPALGNGAGGGRPPTVLFSAHCPSGRTLAAALLALGLDGKGHNVVLADWGFDQSPLMRYFDAEHLAVVYSDSARSGIFVTPRLALFSSSHFSDDDSAATELGRLESLADIVVMSCACPVPARLERRFELGFSVFDYTEESVSKVAETIKDMSAACDKVLALPSRVDLGFPQLALWRERAQAALSDAPAAQKELAKLELPFVASRSGLFDLPRKASDDALKKFVAAAVQTVYETCMPGSSPELAKEGNLPSLREAAGAAAVEFVAPPPLSELPSEEMSARALREKNGREGKGEEAEEARTDSEGKSPKNEEKTAAEKLSDPPLEAAAEAGAPSSSAAPSAPKADAPGPDKVELEFPSAPPPETEKKPGIPAGKDTEDPLIPEPVPFRELEAWVGLDPEALREKYEEALTEAGFTFKGGEPADLFARMNRSFRDWSAAKRSKLWKETLVYLLWLADESHRSGHRVEASIRQRIESVFETVDKPQMASESLRIVRVLNIVGRLAGALASDFVQEHQDAERFMVDILRLVPDGAAAESERLLQLRRMAQGLALALPSLQESGSIAARKSFESERDKLPPRLLRLVSGAKDVPADDGEEHRPAPLDIPINLAGGKRPAANEEQADKPTGPILTGPFPLNRIQEWAGFDIAEPLRQYKSALERNGFILPSEGKAAVEAYASFNLQYRRWSKARRKASWTETVLLCLALAEHARARGESVEGIIRERAEEIIASADGDSNQESMRIIRVLNLIGSICASLESGAPEALKKAERALMQLIDATPDSVTANSDVLLQLRRAGLALALHLPLMKSGAEAEARTLFMKERDRLPDELRRLLPADDIAEKVREIREKVEELI